MASSFPLNKIKCFYIRLLSNGYCGRGTNGTFTNAYIDKYVPYIENSYTDTDGTNVEVWKYKCRETIGGVAYDCWEKISGDGTFDPDNQVGVYAYTNIIVAENGKEFLEIADKNLVSVAYSGTDTTIAEVLSKNEDGFYNLPCPSAYHGNTSTLVSSSRNSKGVVIGDIVREDISKVEITWNFLTLKEYSAIARLFSSTYGGSFFVKVNFFDATANGWLTKIMYPNDREFESAKITLIDGKPVGFTNVSLHLIDTCKEVE